MGGRYKSDNWHRRLFGTRLIAQGGRGRIHASTKFIAPKLVQSFPLLIDRERPPIVCVEWGHQFSVDHLHRFVEPLPNKRSTQDGVTIQHLLPCPFKGGDIEATRQLTTQRYTTVARFGSKTLRKQRFLERR